MKVDIDEFAEKMADFLNETGTWWDFVDYMREEGYEQKEFPPPYDEDGL